jgi:hypothetical protein
MKFIHIIESRLKFPHFPRKLTAGLVKFLKICILFFLLLVLFINLISFLLFKNNTHKSIYYEILKNPQNALPHEKLADYLLGTNEEDALYEYQLAEELYREKSRNRTNVLGIQRSPWQKWLEKKRDKDKNIDDLAYWTKVRTKFPNYQYALYKLAALNFEINNLTSSTQYIRQVLANYPSDKTAGDMESKVNNGL